MRPAVLVAGLFVLSRAVALAGLLSVSGAAPAWGGLVNRLDLGTALREAAATWDSNWYQIIVTSGYAHSTPTTPKAGFYPGYPLLVSAVYQPLRALAGWPAPGSPSPPAPTPAGPFGMDPLLNVSMLVVANVSLVVALVVLWRLYEPELGATAAVIGCGLLLTA